MTSAQSGSWLISVADNQATLWIPSRIAMPAIEPGTIHAYNLFSATGLQPVLYIQDLSKCTNMTALEEVSLKSQMDKLQWIFFIIKKCTIKGVNITLVEDEIRYIINMSLMMHLHLQTLRA